MWEMWYTYANEKFKIKQQAQLKQEEMLHKQQEDEEKMANDLAMDLLGETFSFQSSEGNGFSASQMGNVSKESEKNGDNLCSTTTTNRSVTKTKMETEVDIANKTLTLSKDIQDIVVEIADLFLDPNVVFAMRKLKEVGKAMKNSPSVADFSKEVSYLTNLQKNQESQNDVPIDKDKIKKELTYEDPKQNPKRLFPACEPTTFDQFTSVMKAPKCKPGASPARLGQISSPKNQKKNQATKLKSLTETKMDIIAEGFNVLKRKKASKVAQPLWNEVSSLGRVVLNPPDTGFYSLMGNVNFFPQLEKLQESARGMQLKTELFDFIGSNVQYARVSFLQYFKTSSTSFS